MKKYMVITIYEGFFLATLLRFNLLDLNEIKQYVINFNQNFLVFYRLFYII